MKILPILFNTEMVRALLEERKTVTRRVVRGVEISWSLQGLDRDPAVFHIRADGEACPKTVKGLYATFEADPGVWFPIFKAPYKPGDILYVRETWAVHPCRESDWLTPDLRRKCRKTGEGMGCYIFAADGLNGITPCGMSVAPHKWHPSIHMPKEAARIFLKVKSVRVERLQDITPEQVDAEGCKEWGYSSTTGELLPSSSVYFKIVWNDTIKPADMSKYGWAANPWVWVIEFARTDKPEGWPDMEEVAR